MTISRSISLTCPQCGTESTFTAHESVNVTENPELKAPLLEGRLWTHTCASCGTVARIAHPLLYQDMNLAQGQPGASLMVMLTFEDDFDATELDAGMSDLQFLSRLSAQTTRVVRSHNELMEKIHVIEEGLDDRCIEVLKAMIRQQEGALKESELLYNGRTDQGDINIVALSPQGPAGITVPYEEYERLRDTLTGLFGALAFVRWAQVGKEFGDQLVGRLGAAGEA